MSSQDPSSLRATAALLALTLAFPNAVAAQTESPDGNPRNGEVRIDAHGGWDGFVVWDTEGPGIWCVENIQVRPDLGCPEIVALDDDGRCTVLISYSGKWTPQHSVHSGTWLGPVVHGDFDPDVEGNELYVGGQSGSVYRVSPAAIDRLEDEEIAHFGRDEVHMLALGDYWPEREGPELVVFQRKGEVHVLRHENGEVVRSFAGLLPGRVRDVRPYLVPGQRPRLITASRAQEVALVGFDAEGHVEREVILKEPMGFGRLSQGVGEFKNVWYTTRDDGLVLRLENVDGTWRREAIYAGPQGLRGLAAGHFTDVDGEETVAVFGYSAKVQLLRRKHRETTWQV
jgi:hypothetical protein